MLPRERGLQKGAIFDFDKTQSSPIRSKLVKNQNCFRFISLYQFYPFQWCVMILSYFKRFSILCNSRFQILIFIMIVSGDTPQSLKVYNFMKILGCLQNNNRKSEKVITDKKYTILKFKIRRMILNTYRTETPYNYLQFLNGSKLKFSF